MVAVTNKRSPVRPIHARHKIRSMELQVPDNLVRGLMANGAGNIDQLHLGQEGPEWPFSERSFTNLQFLVGQLQSLISLTRAFRIRRVRPDGYCGGFLAASTLAKAQ
jgi:hypothetical protein